MESALKELDFGAAAYDLATADKLPSLIRLVRGCPTGDALDVGIGTGYTTQAVFGDRRVACVDVHLPNLRFYRDVRASSVTSPAWFVGSEAGRIPFRDASFSVAMVSEVLEHLDDDDSAVAELARVLRPGGRVLVTVPCISLGFAGFLELLRIPTVHDQPGPEQHVRPGYTPESLTALLERHGLAVVETEFCLRPVTKLVVDAVALVHMLYQRVFHGRKSWTWAEATEITGSGLFTVFRVLFPILLWAPRIDRVVLSRFRGFGLVAVAQKPIVQA